MSLSNISGLVSVPSVEKSIYSAATSQTLDVANERLANVFVAADSGNVRYVWFRTQSITRNATVRLSVQSVTTDTGLPSGTILGNGSSGFVDLTTDVFTTVTGWKGPFQLGADVPIVVGNAYAVVIQMTSNTTGTFQVPGPMIKSAQMQIYGLNDVGAPPSGSWTKLTEGACYSLALEYDDGTYPYGYIGNCAGLTVPLNTTNATADEVGNRFTPTVPMTAKGFWAQVSVDGSPLVLTLQSTAGTVLASATIIDVGVRATSGIGTYYIPFTTEYSTSVNLTKDTNYHIVITPQSSSTGSSARSFIICEAAAMTAYDYSTRCVGITRVDGGAWTEVSTARYEVGLLISAFDDGVSTASGGAPFLYKAREN